MVAIDLYSYTDRENTVNKTLTNPTTIEGFMRDAVNILQPVIRLKHTGTFNYNYCFVRELNRYYYITGYTVLDNTQIELRLRIDVLKTYEDAIMAATGTVIERSDANKFISLRRQVFDARPNIEHLDFPEQDLFDSNGHIIMVTLNGKTS